MSKPNQSAVIFLGQENYIETIKEWQRDDLSIVFTNGCFDILHAGHIEYLTSAAKLGDKMIIGLNDDASVTQLKGSERPINKSEDRAKVLASLYMVDMIIIFREETPLYLIDEIDPDHLVKGGDYKMDEIVGAKLMKQRGKEVHIMPEKKGYSTTRIIDSSQNQ